MLAPESCEFICVIQETPGDAGQGARRSTLPRDSRRVKDEKRATATSGSPWPVARVSVWLLVEASIVGLLQLIPPTAEAEARQHG